jgi:predicted HNH restriction endonuclease
MRTKAEQHLLRRYSDFEEGRLRLRQHYQRERNSAETTRLKLAAYRQGDLTCAACQVNYGARLGEAALSLVEVHHAVPLHSAKHGGVTRVKDLVLLCANCHRLVHSKWFALSLPQLRRSLKSRASHAKPGARNAVRGAAS